MSRLTEVNVNGIYCKELNCENTCYECDSEAYCYELKEMIEKLAHYEDLEEQGRLIELPCKVGDTVYVFKTYADCELNYECDQWHSHKCEDNKYCKHEYAIKRVGEAKFNLAMLATLGKTVFITKE